MKKLLVINPFGIGDAIFSMTVVEALRHQNPDLVIGFICNERTQELVRLNRSIDQTFVFNRDALRLALKKSPFLFLKELQGFWGLVRSHQFDATLDFSLSREFSFFSFLIGIPKRVGLDFKGRGLFLTHKQKIVGYEARHVIHTQAELLKFFGIESFSPQAELPLYVSDESLKMVAATFKKEGILPTDKVVVCAPGGGRSWGVNAHFKQWNPEQFAAALNQLSETKPFKIILLGDGPEIKLLQETARHLNISAMVVTSEGLAGVAALLKRSELLLCNDGGLLHFANALGVKTVSIFGPVDEKVYGPFPGQAKRQVVVQDVPCRPCYQRFTFPPCTHERQCLEKVAVEQVVEAALKII